MRRFKNIFVPMGMFFLLTYRLRRWIIALGVGISRPRYRVDVQRNIRIPMSDGIFLVADHYMPKKHGRYPTVLIRLPYGRNHHLSAYGWLQEFEAQRFAERGYHVIVQDVRGRFDSQGSFNPFFNEHDDGLVTIEWIKRQPWFDGRLGAWGGSYLGLVQWAFAADSEDLTAFMPIVTGSNMYDIVYPGEAFDLGLALRWMSILKSLHDRKYQSTVWAYDTWSSIEKTINPVLDHLPVKELDQLVVGEQVPYFQDWLAHDEPDDPLWEDVLASVRLDQVTAPAHFIGGWFDFFLNAMLQDYRALRDNGQHPRLTIGPWTHFNINYSFIGIKAGLQWFEEQLHGNLPDSPADPVQVYVMGAKTWRGFSDWPPPARETAYYLQPEGRLQTIMPAVQDAYDTYDYDPADPTPAVGGTIFGPWHAGMFDNSALESRDDVLVFTTPPLKHDIDVIGPVRLKLYASTSLETTDFVGRLCDVRADGRSWNVCDGLYRIQPGSHADNGIHRVDVDMWATAYRFKRGHRIRLQVSSGAHPRWMRNLGTTHPLPENTKYCVAHQRIYHDKAHPSALYLPIV
jgi:uncharacterized protein